MSGAASFDIGALLTPTAFAHPVGEIAVRQTHISWVVLTGPFAYKIKKPVRFDFLDASTLERRRFLCEEELRLNRRFAAELYLDVVAISQTGGGTCVGGGGTAIEHAVRMHQFGAGDELASLLERSEITAAEIEVLARLLADFHAGASRASAPTAQRIADTLLGNLAELESNARSLGERDSIEPLSAWMRERVEVDRASLDERAQHGWIRECHGDLHARNVVRYRGRLLPFDCLEFNPELRSIDVIDDLAFLVMDTASHGREDLAFILLNRYLECTGDYGGAALLPLYAVHRALVRAKVDALSAQGAAQRRSEFAQRFERRIHAARAWAHARHPTLVLMHGVSGSGKSWLSERLVSLLPAVRIRSDVERKRLAGMHASESAADRVRGGIYSEAFTRRTYGRLLEHASACLRAGLTTIVDATFLEATERRSFLALAEQLGVHAAIIACEAPPDVLAERIRERARASDRASDADLQVLGAQLAALQPLARDEAHRVVRVDTGEAGAVATTAEALRGTLAESR